MTYVFASAEAFYRNVLNSIGNFFASAWHAITSFFGMIFSAIGSFFGTIFDYVGNFFEMIGDFISPVTGPIGDFLSPIFNEIGEFFISIGLSIGGFFSDLWNSVVTFDLIDTLESLDKFGLLRMLKELDFYRDLIYGIFYFILAYIIIQTIITCIVFHKADVPWWKALIPVYGTYNTYGLADCEVIFCFNLLISFIFLPLMNADMPTAILTIYILLMVVLEFTFCYMLAINFGKGIDCAVGLFLLRPIYLAILAFDKSKYTFGGPLAAPITRNILLEQQAAAAADKDDGDDEGGSDDSEGTSADLIKETFSEIPEYAAVEYEAADFAPSDAPSQT